MTAFQMLVLDNLRWFSGRMPETHESFDAAERALGVYFPDDLRWLLTTHGYWHATPVRSLDAAVSNTLQARQHANLPQRFVVLEDIDCETFELLDSTPDPVTDCHAIHFVSGEEISDPIGADSMVYRSYLEYTKDILEREMGNIAEEDIDYDPGKDGFRM